MPYQVVNQASSVASIGAWIDSAAVGFSNPNGVVAPSRTTFTTNTAGWEWAVNDYADGVIQLGHDCQKSSPLDVHVHFSFPSQPTAGYHPAWQLYYCYSKIDGTFAEVAPAAIEYTVAASDNKVHRVFEIASITGDAASPQSSILIVRVKRVARLTGTECDVNPLVWACDAHYKSRYAGGTVVELGP